MSSLSGVSFSTDKPKQELSDVAYAALIDGTQKLFKNCVLERIRLYNLFWKNPAAGCDPASLAQKAGTNLKSLFENDAELVAFISGLEKSASLSLPPLATQGVPDGYAVAFNPDGSGTIIKTN